MRRFKDSTGRTWRLTIDVAALMRVRDLAGLDVLATDGATLAQIVYHPTDFADVLLSLLDADDSLLDALDGDALARAAEAFTAELTSFFPPPSPSKRLAAASKPADPWRTLYRLAGILGVDPGPFTLRQLADMADGRRRSEWLHTSALLAMLFNTTPHKGEGKSPDDFFPFDKEEAEKSPAKFPMTVLMPFFVKPDPAPAPTVVTPPVAPQPVPHVTEPQPA